MLFADNLPIPRQTIFSAIFPIHLKNSLKLLREITQLESVIALLMTDTIRHF